MPQKGQRGSRLPLAAVLVAIAAVLYLAREVLVPIALAVFVSFVLAPIVRMLERWKLPRAVAVVLTVSFATVSLGIVGWFVEQQAVEVAGNLQEYKSNVARKLRALRATGPDAITKAGSAIEELGKEIAKPGTHTEGETLPARAPAEPVTVKLLQEPTPPITYLRDMLGPMLARLATALMVVVFAIFMLLRREDLRDRLIRLVGEREMHITTPALDDAAQRLSRYLLTQSMVNAGVGLAVGVGLFFIGLPSAALWGFNIAILRFVPYVGTWIGAAFPILLSVAISDGWREPLMVAGLVIGAEVIGGSFVEPLLVGSGTGLSPLAVLTSAVFWAWLWGPIGLVLSTPIAVCLSVAGRHVRSLAFLNVILGDEPVLTPEARFYQRLLAGDQEESARIVEEFARGKELVQVYDQLLIPALKLAEIDRHRGELDESQESGVRDILTAIVEDLGAGAGAPEDAPVEILCLPARDSADELSARMLERALGKRGLRADWFTTTLSPRDLVQRLAERPAAIVCVCAVPPNALLHTRVLAQQIQLRGPQHAIVVGLIDDTLEAEGVRTKLGDGVDVAFTLEQTVERVAELAASGQKRSANGQLSRRKALEAGRIAASRPENKAS